MNRTALLISIIFILSCGTSTTSKPEYIRIKDPGLVDSVKTEIPAQNAADSIVLYEDRIKSIALPFGRREMLPELKKEFKGLTITKETGQQDGPDFPLYSFKEGKNEICFFAMDWEDTLKLNEVYIKQPLIKDQYGLKVGDDYQKIKRLRNGNAKTYTDLHQHTFVYFENSKIMYEISGSVYLQDTDNLEFTEEQIKDWTIDYILWRE